MVEAGVQIPLDALCRVRHTQDVGKPGNPPAWGAGERRFKSDHPDWRRKGEPTGMMAPGWKPDEALALAGSSPVPSAGPGVCEMPQAPGRFCFAERYRLIIP